MTFGVIVAEPYAGLAWVHLDTRSFTETGGVSALAGTGNKDDVGYSTLGARAASYYLLQNGMALIPRASVAWQHAFGAVTPTAALAFQRPARRSASPAFPLRAMPRWSRREAICNSPRRPRSASLCLPTRPTARMTIRSKEFYLALLTATTPNV
jgi:hypothetical protein